MNVEEILLKLGIRTDSFSQGITKAKAEVTNLGEHVKKNFTSKDGQGLVDLFKDLTQQSPLLGTALKVALNPIVGTFTAATAAFFYFRDKINDWTENLDKQGERMSKPWGKMKDALFGARGEAQKSQQEFAWWEQDLTKGKPGEVEDIGIRKRIEAAKVESKGDEIKFIKSKIAIQEEERAIAEQQKLDALERARGLQATQEDVKVLASAKDRASKRDTAIKEQERLAEEIKKQEEKLKSLQKMKDSPIAAAGDELFKGEQTKAALSLEMAGTAALSVVPGVGGLLKEGAQVPINEILSREKAKLDQLFSEREKAISYTKKLEDADIKGSAIARQNAHDLQETQAEADKAKERSLALEKSIADDRAKLFELERKRREEDLKDAIAKAEKKAGADKVSGLKARLDLEEKALKTAASLGDDEEQRKLQKQIATDQEALAVEEVNKAKAQEKLDRDMAYMQQKRREHVNEPYLATYNELAGYAPWDPFMESGFAQQRAEDQAALYSGNAYASKYAEQARELQLTEEDARMALRVEGPESRRYKQDLEKIESLKKGLEASGLTKGDTPLDKIDKNIADLLETARKEGLVVQPVNGK